jgi:hypothetical protein
VGRDSVVDIATCYGLDGPGIESLWGRDFQHPSRPAQGPTQSSMQWVTGFFPGDKAGGGRGARGLNHPPPSKAEVKGRIELYLYSPSGPSWPIIGRTLPLPYLVLVYVANFLKQSESCEVFFFFASVIMHRVVSVISAVFTVHFDTRLKRSHFVYYPALCT